MRQINIYELELVKLKILTKNPLCDKDKIINDQSRDIFQNLCTIVAI